MYYHSFDVNCGRYAIGIARSRNGIRWVKLGKVLDGGAARCLWKWPNEYRLAESVDGLKNWRRCGDGPILSASTEDNGWDNQGIGDPCLIRVEGGMSGGFIMVVVVGVGEPALDGGFGGWGAR
uniref:Uncharacterized protein n=1 Tax=Ananas comosus var. bracteatus TaxID=296719 RepID=A0A6V7P6P1_ANACO|nr:unnamed protein product [Ananas comosus var. bracteatus]